jgi:hypothetical protein
MNQLAGYKRYTFSEGRAKGTEAVDIDNGNGLKFTVLLDKCLDIAGCSFNGINLSYMTSNGIVAPQFYDSHGTEWLRSFVGGLLSTCGVTYCGAPCEDDGEQLGLHGRISNCPADNICCDAYWEEDEYVIKIRGRSYETRLHGETLELRREIKVYTGENKIYVSDEIENKGYKPNPIMMIYHVNFGFPLYDEGCEIFIDSVECLPNDKEAKKMLEQRFTATKPQHGVLENVYFNHMNKERGYGLATLINRKLDSNGLGMYVKFDLEELPYLNQWKMVAEGHYVLGLEPANCKSLGRANERTEGRLVYIEPGEIKCFNVELGIIENADLFFSKINKNR